MNKLKKIIVISLAGVLLLNTAIVSAENLGNQNEQAVKKYQNSKSNYLDAVQFYKNARSNFITAKNRFAENKDKVGNQDLLAKAKEFISKSIQVSLRYLETLKTKAQNSPFLTDQERADIISEIDSDISWLNKKAEEVNKATTKQQILNEAIEIRNRWLKIRAGGKRITGEMLAARLNIVIEKFETNGEKAQEKIDALKANGIDTTELDIMMAEYNENLTLAKSKYEAAKNAFKSITTLSGGDNLFKNGHKFIQEAKVYLKEAHKDLKEIVREIKAAADDTDDGEEATSTPTTAE